MKTPLGLITLLFCTSATLAVVSALYSNDPIPVLSRHGYLYLQPLSKGTTLLIEPRTLQYYASFVNSKMILQNSNTVMYFPQGTINEELIRIPLGETDPHAVIRITVAKKEESGDSDPRIGLTDRVNENVFILADNNGECYPVDAAYRGPVLPPGSDEHYEYTLLFEPFQNYGACSHLGGHVTPGYFNKRIDPTRGLDFIVRRYDAAEEYGFYYFLIEIL